MNAENINSYSFLKEYIFHEELFENDGVKSVMKFPHHFYTPHPVYMEKALAAIDPFPKELKCFYEEIGYGFMHRKSEKINRLFDPVSLMMINLLQEDFKYNKEIREEVAHYNIEKQLLFFQSGSGKYVVIDRTDNNGENAIYYRNHKLTDSLYEFICTYHKNKDWLEYVLDE